MIPRLFERDTTKFDSEGMGRLTDAIKCECDWQENGGYELALKYPIGGVHFEELTADRIIYTIPAPYRNPQPFFIYRIDKPLNGVCTFHARHISYKLSGVTIAPGKADTAPEAMQFMQRSAFTPHNFKFSTNLSTAAKFTVQVPTTARALLGGHRGSLLDVYGGIWDFDGYNVRLVRRLGKDNGVSILYGKNLADVSQENSFANVRGGIIPFWTDKDKAVTYAEPKIIMAPGMQQNSPVVPVDFTADFEAKPTPEQLKKRGERFVRENKIGIPRVNLRVQVVPVEQAAGHEGITLTERVDWDDTVTVRFEALGVDATAKVVGTLTDTLSETYVHVDIGDARPNLADTLVQQSTALQEQKEEIKNAASSMQDAIDNATDWITNTKGGNIVFRRYPDGGAYEQLFMDTTDIATAKNVWRFNLGGLGFSNHGYNGPFPVAITQDGHIVADFITVGTLLADIIKAGVLSSKNKAVKLSMETGSLQFFDENGNKCVELYRHPGYYGGFLYFYGETFETHITADGIAIDKVERDASGKVTKRENYFNADYTGDLMTKGTIFAKGQIQADGDIFSNKTLNSKGDIFSNGTLYMNGQVQAKGNIYSSGSLDVRNAVWMEQLFIRSKDGQTGHALAERANGENRIYADSINGNTVDYKLVKLDNGELAWALCAK